MTETSHTDADLPPRHDIPAGGRSGFVMIDGRQVHYLEWGRKASPAVVCLHGAGQTAYMYEDLGAALAGRYHVVAYDFPDHGDSDPGDLPKLAIDRHFLAGTTAAVCAEFGLDNLLVVGGSMGGLTGATLAATQPHLVRGLVMLDVGHRVEQGGADRIIDFMSTESFASLEEAAKAIETYSPGRTVVPGRLTRNLRQRPDGRWVWKHGLGRRFREFSDSITVDPAQPDVWIVDGLQHDLRTLACPVLVLRGSRSDILSVDGADELVGAIPNARFATIRGAGHLAAGDNPRSFVDLVTRFFDELSAYLA